MDALASAHDAAVQMIDTSIVRVHQHAACIARNKRQSMGWSRGGLTSKIRAVVDRSGLPVRLALTTGQAHDNRLAAKLLSRLKCGSMLLADRVTRAAVTGVRQVVCEFRHLGSRSQNDPVGSRRQVGHKFRVSSATARGIGPHPVPEK